MISHSLVFNQLSKSVIFKMDVPKASRIAQKESRITLVNTDLRQIVLTAINLELIDSCIWKLENLFLCNYTLN